MDVPYKHHIRKWAIKVYLEREQIHNINYVQFSMVCIEVLIKTLVHDSESLQYEWIQKDARRANEWI